MPWSACCIVLEEGGERLGTGTEGFEVAALTEGFGGLDLGLDILTPQVFTASDTEDTFLGLASWNQLCVSG